jgi:hypothetical protein
MSAQRLSARSIRRIERSIGEPVLRAWSHGGYWMAFVTPDHRHGSWHRRTTNVAWHGDGVRHYETCRETWPEDFK